MSRKVEWDWQRHITPEEDAECQRLRQEADELEERLDAIRGQVSAIVREATARAKEAGSKRVPFVL